MKKEDDGHLLISLNLNCDFLSSRTQYTLEEY